MAKTKKARRIKLSQVVTAEHFATPPFPIRLTEDDENKIIIPHKVQLFKTGIFKKLQEDGTHIEFEITREILAEFVTNFKKKVRGVDLAIDFAHKSDDEAAGWIKDLKIEDGDGESQLWAEVDWTPDGRAALAKKKFRYMSPDFSFKYQDNESGKKFGPTLFGAGLTNRPVIKNMAPVVELTEVERMAKKTTKKISELTKEEIQIRLGEEKDEEKRELLQLRLDEMMADESGDEDDEPTPQDKKKMTMDELQAAYEKVCAENEDLKKQLATKAAEAKTAKKKADFDKLLSEGKVVEAQRDPFMKDDTVKFAELQVPVKLKAIGANGEPIIEAKTTAQDKVLKLAEEKVEKKLAKTRWEAIPMVLAENKDLATEYRKEFEETGAAATV